MQDNLEHVISSTNYGHLSFGISVTESAYSRPNSDRTVMPRFFFNIYDGKAYIDLDGEEMPNWQAAQAYAVRYMGKMIDKDTDLFIKDKEWHMNVTDEHGLILIRINFSMIISPILNNIYSDHLNKSI